MFFLPFLILSYITVVWVVIIRSAEVQHFAAKTKTIIEKQKHGAISSNLESVYQTLQKEELQSTCWARSENIAEPDCSWEGVHKCTHLMGLPGWREKLEAKRRDWRKKWASITRPRTLLTSSTSSMKGGYRFVFCARVTWYLC